MKTISQSEQEALEKLLYDCDSFPASTTTSTMLYNYARLLAILQDKEIQQFDPTPGANERVYVLTRQFGTIASNIVRKVATNPLEEYQRLEQTVEHELAGNMYLYAKQWGLSVKALYYYKQSDYQKGIDFSLECIALNDYLIRLGVHTLLFRSAEQNRNISRILFRKQDWVAAAGLAKDLLRYLFQGQAGKLHGTIFSNHAYWEKNEYVREGYAYECFRAFVSQMIQIERANMTESPDIFYLLFDGLEIDITSPDRLIIANWLEIKRAYKNGNYTAFISDFIEYMMEPMSQLYDILKISLFLDVKQYVHDSDFQKKDTLVVKIKKHLDEKLNISENLKKDLGAKNFTNNDFNFNEKQDLVSAPSTDNAA